MAKRTKKTGSIVEPKKRGRQKFSKGEVNLTQLLLCPDKDDFRINLPADITANIINEDSNDTELTEGEEKLCNYQTFFHFKVANYINLKNVTSS
jgi:hypothetical protein